MCSKKFISTLIENSFHEHQVDIISDGFHMRPGPKSIKKVKRVTPNLGSSSDFIKPTSEIAKIV